MKLPAFFFDIDGTLLHYPSGLTEISPKTKEALDKLRINHPTFIASGRTKCFIDEKILSYPFDGFVTCNGAYVEYQNNCVYKHPMALDSLLASLKVADEIDAVVYLESRDHMYVYNSNNPLHADFAYRWGMNPEVVVTDFDPKEIEVYIGMIVVGKEEDCAVIMERLSPYFEVSQHVNQLSFDLTLKGQSKAVGIDEVMKYFNGTLQDAWAFGDANNDIEMISAVGHGIAMGNAVEAIKEIADDITLPAWEDGIAYTLKKYNWID